MKFLLKICASAALGACAMGALAQQPTIKIAHIDTFSGPTASTGATISKTMQYAVDLVNQRGGVLGRKFELVPMDNGGDPTKAISMLNSAVGQDINLITQAGNSAIASALLGAIEKHNKRNVASRVLFLNYGSALPELTGERCSFWFFRFGAHQLTNMHAIADYVAKDPKIKKIYLINQDYSAGRGVSADAKRLIAQARPDIEFVGDDFHPFGTIKDFSPYILKIRQSGADTVLSGNFGNDLTLLVRAGKESGLGARYITLYGGMFGIPNAIGPAGENSVFQVTPWHPNVPVEQKKPDFEKYQKEFKAKYGEDLYNVTTLVQMDMLARAMEKANSATDVKKIAEALEGMDYDSPFGAVKMRKDDHQITHPIYISQLVKGVKYNADSLNLGWKTVATISGAETELPSTCNMVRPN